MNLQTELAPKKGLVLRNPVVIASGTFGYGVDNADMAEIHRLGAITCKGTTLHPRSGNEEPRILETASGMLNAIGLQNPGIITVIEQYAPIWATWQTPVIVNIAGETVEEFAELARLSLAQMRRRLQMSPLRYVVRQHYPSSSNFLPIAGMCAQLHWPLLHLALMPSVLLTPSQVWVSIYASAVLRWRTLQVGCLALR